MVTGFQNRAHQSRKTAFVFAACALLTAECVFSATPADPNFSISTFVSDATKLGNSPASPDGQVNGITCMAWAPDGANRLYVTTKGRSDGNASIQVIRNGVIQSVPFYTFNTGVETNNECGLESLVFHPDYASGTKQIYCYLTVSTTEQQVVRFTEMIDVNGNYVATGAPTTIISGIPTADQNHNGGGLTIAPDQNGNGRFVYWACGNNGNGTNRGERLDNSNLGCKIGRANLDGSVPGDGLNASGYIWAYGYRNPYTMTTQPGTGKLWVNVVGDGYEQIFMPTPGSWAGDNDFENGANSGDSTLTAKQIVPIVKYRTGGTDSRTISTASRSGSTVTYTTTADHGFRKGEKITVSGVSAASFNASVYVLATPGAATFTATLAGADASGTGGTAVTQSIGNCITGGAFNTATAWGSAFQGNFFFGDYGSGRITRVQLNTDNSVKAVDSFITGGGRITDVTFGPDGNMYFGVIDAGTIYKVTFSALSISPASLPATTVGASYNQTLTASGGTTPYTWSVLSGSLPNNLTLNTSSGVITGTPSTAGTFNFTVQAADSASRTGQKTYSIVVNGAPTIATTSLPAGTVGVAYNQTLSGSGGTSPLTWSVSVGSLPAGLSLNASSGAITGNPTTAGTSTFTIMLKDSVNVSTTKQLSITIGTGNTAPQITSTAVTSGNIGVAYSYDVNASGNPAPTYSLTTMPAGMTVNTSSGVISWTPSAKGAFNVVVKAANGTTPDATQSFTINVTDYGLDKRVNTTAFLGLNTASLPATLSATGVFSNTGSLTAANQMIPYTVNSPLWSDAAVKSRWIAVPNDGAPYGATETIGFAPTGEWTFPGGTVLVKHFELGTDDRNPAIRKRLETRLLFVNNDGTVFGATYKWRSDNTNADLLPDFVDEDISITTSTGGTRTQRWHYPSRAECLQCHTQNAGGVLGVKTRQQNGNFSYAATGVTDNQLRTWNYLGLFNTTLNESTIPTYTKLVPLMDSAASLETKVRSYIDSNCAQCHRPGGAPALFDARFDTPITNQNIINGPVNNNLGLAMGKVIVPQDVPNSIMDRRMNTTDTAIRMPPLARNVIDTLAVSVLEQWIGSLSPSSNGTGLFGTYYDNMDFTGAMATRVDPQVNFDWGTGAPIAGIGADTFSVRWSGQILAPNTETFTFYTTTDDGVRLWVNNQLLIDKWINQGPTEWSGTIALNAGQKYNMVMEYYENGGGSVAKLFWSSPSNAKGAVPQNALFAVAPPAAPTNVTAVAASDVRINLTWTDNATNESSYEIQRSPDNAIWSVLTSIAANSTSYADQNLTPATLYYYRVRAVNFAGNSAFAGSSATTMSGGGGGGGSGMKVNFQLAGAPVPSGYVADTGAAFGDRGNGFSYGWNIDNSTTARDRNSPSSPDQRYDTLEHMQKPENPNAVWEIAVANGSYSVRIVSGDPSNIDSVYKINVEGILAINATPTSTVRWFDATVTVNVADGRITISNAAGSANNKICFVDIAPAAGAAARWAEGDLVQFLEANATYLSTSMQFTKPGNDAYSLKALLPDIPAGFALKGQELGVDVGGAVATFVLDAKGNARTKQGRVTAKFERDGKGLLISLSLRRGKWTEAWSDAGIDKSTPKSTLQIPFVITFNGVSYGGVKDVNYVSRPGKSGKSRSPRK
jgi:uncharacterized repeat protein (TIGR03806 family)